MGFKSNALICSVVTCDLVRFTLIFQNQMLYGGKCRNRRITNSTQTRTLDLSLAYIFPLTSNTTKQIFLH